MARNGIEHRPFRVHRRLCSSRLHINPDPRGGHRGGMGRIARRARRTAPFGHAVERVQRASEQRDIAIVGNARGFLFSIVARGVGQEPGAVHDAKRGEDLRLGEVGPGNAIVVGAAGLKQFAGELENVERGEQPCAFLKDGAVVGFLGRIDRALEAVDRLALGLPVVPGGGEGGAVFAQAGIDQPPVGVVGGLRGADAGVALAAVEQGPDKVSTPRSSVWRKLSE
jgi:hypothetical protein